MNSSAEGAMAIPDRAEGSLRFVSQGATLTAALSKSFTHSIDPPRYSLRPNPMGMKQRFSSFSLAHSIHRDRSRVSRSEASDLLDRGTGSAETLDFNLLCLLAQTARTETRYPGRDRPAPARPGQARPQNRDDEIHLGAARSSIQYRRINRPVVSETESVSRRPPAFSIVRIDPRFEGSAVNKARSSPTTRASANVRRSISPA